MSRSCGEIDQTVSCHPLEAPHMVNPPVVYPPQAVSFPVFSVLDGGKNERVALRWFVRHCTILRPQFMRQNCSDARPGCCMGTLCQLTSRM